MAAQPNHLGTVPHLKSTRARMIAATLEFIVICVLVALVPQVVYLDTSVINDQMTEESVTEYLHNSLLLIALVAYGAGASRFPSARGYLVLVATVFACMFIRENDVLFDHVWHGFWIVPGLTVFVGGLWYSLRNSETLVGPMLRHLETRSATFVYIGVILLVIFTRLFGTGSLWEAVMRDAYDPSFKAAIQEGLELLSYLLICYGACLSYLRGFGTRTGSAT